MAALKKFRDENRGYSEVHKVIKRSYNCCMLSCISYVRFSQAAEGTIENLSKALEEMRRGDVLDILQDRHDSGFDSGFGSQSLSFNKSEGNVCASIDLELKDVIFGPLGLLQQFSNCKLLKNFLSYLGSPHWYWLVIFIHICVQIKRKTKHISLKLAVWVCNEYKKCRMRSSIFQVVNHVTKLNRSVI